MRISIDLTSLADNFSGIERYAAELSRALIGIDDKNEYVLVFKEAVHPFFSRVVGSRSNVVAEVLPRGNKGKLFFSQFALPHSLKKIKPDLALFFAFPAPLFYSGKSMSTFHDVCWHDVPETMLLKSRIYWKTLQEINARRNVALLTVSEFSKRRIVEVLDVSPEKIFVTYNGVDRGIFNPNNAGAVSFGVLREKYNLPERYVLTLSTIEPRKNIGLLMDAWSMACQEYRYEPDLVLAGRKGWKQDALLERVPLELRPRVHFTGFVDDKDLPALYGLSELFVFPTIYEGFGLPPVEAAYCGARVLCSDIPCLREVCGSGVAYFKSDDIDDLERALLDERSRDSVNGVVRDYSWADSAGILFHEVLHG